MYKINRLSNSLRSKKSGKSLAYNLRPYHLDRLSLTQSIKAMLESVGASSEIDFAFDIIPIENVFPKYEKIIVYLIIQECANNIFKHPKTRADKRGHCDFRY